MVSIKTIYSRAFAVLRKKPFLLWGISLLAMLLSALSVPLLGVIPAASIAVSMLLQTAMTLIYLRGYRGEEIAVTQLFDTFKDWKTVKRVLCGMGWASLWIFLWSLIPVAGIVFGIIRTYEYRLTPYILMHEPDVPITEAIKVSREKTRGYKAKMFGADALYVVVIAAAEILLALLAMIPPAASSLDRAMIGLGRQTWKRLQRLVYGAAILTVAHWLLLEWHWQPVLLHAAPVILVWLALGLRRLKSGPDPQRTPA